LHCHLSASAIGGVFADIEETHQYEEELRKESVALIEADLELSGRLEMIQKAMALIEAYVRCPAQR
jgi:hypothetical protein